MTVYIQCLIVKYLYFWFDWDSLGNRKLVPPIIPQVWLYTSNVLSWNIYIFGLIGTAWATGNLFLPLYLRYDCIHPMSYREIFIFLVWLGQPGQQETCSSNYTSGMTVYIQCHMVKYLYIWIDWDSLGNRKLVPPIIPRVWLCTSNVIWWNIYIFGLIGTAWSAVNLFLQLYLRYDCVHPMSYGEIFLSLVWFGLPRHWQVNLTQGLVDFSVTTLFLPDLSVHNIPSAIRSLRCI